MQTKGKAKSSKSKGQGQDRTIGDRFGAFLAYAIDQGWDRVQVVRGRDGEPAGVMCGSHEAAAPELVMSFDEARLATAREFGELCTKLGGLTSPPAVPGAWLEGDGLERLTAYFLAVNAASKAAEKTKAELLGRLQASGRTSIETPSGSVVLKPGAARTQVDQAGCVARIAELAAKLTELGVPTSGDPPKKTHQIAPYLEVVPPRA